MNTATTTRLQTCFGAALLTVALATGGLVSALIPSPYDETALAPPTSDALPTAGVSDAAAGIIGVEVDPRLLTFTRSIA